ncbi:MAG: hypothetical protein AAGM67_21695, partial [Bacteroidota bacterium]
MYTHLNRVKALLSDLNSLDADESEKRKVLCFLLSRMVFCLWVKKCRSLVDKCYNVSVYDGVVSQMAELETHLKMFFLFDDVQFNSQEWASHILSLMHLPTQSTSVAMKMGKFSFSIANLLYSIRMGHSDNAVYGCA